MAKKVFINGVSTIIGGHLDMVALGDDFLSYSPEYIEVTASNTYRAYTSANKYRNKYMYKGIAYPGNGITKVTASAGTNLTVGICYFVF